MIRSAKLVNSLILAMTKNVRKTGDRQTDPCICYVT